MLGAEASGYVGFLIRPIRSVARGCVDELTVAMANARAGADEVTKALYVPDLMVLPAFYDIESGEVVWL